MVYVICYINAEGNNVWEERNGNADLQLRICELMKELNCDADDIMVFIKQTQLR